MEGDDDRPSWWDAALRLKDELTLKDIADRVGVDPGTVAAEFARRGIRRRIRVDGAHAAELPPEAGEPMEHEVDVDDASHARRSGSKDLRIEKHFHLLGKVPDSEVARLAEVSIRTIASYRARNDIAGYDGPRRRPAPRGRRTSKVDDFGPLLGRVPDRVVADIAGMSLGAVRNFRIKKGLPAAGRITRREIDKLVHSWERGHPSETAAAAPPRPPATVERKPDDGSEPKRAWRVQLLGGLEAYVVLASSLLDAVAQAVMVAGGDAAIASIDALGKVL